MRTIHDFDGMIGPSRPMQQVFGQIRRVARLDVLVLIVGESGTGKELVARSIHNRSKRSAGPFVPVHTGAIAPELIPSELFGHEKGAFTGATYQQKGTFETANGGTLLLDEISTMDVKTQISLLRVLETKKFRRVGGRQYVITDTRIVAATNENLGGLVREGRFREDLFHRLNVFRITLPPLRERGEDVRVLAAHFVKRYAREFDKPVQAIEPEALALLRHYDWRGNVRELENVLMRAIIASEGDTILVRDLPPEVHASGPGEEQLAIRVGMTLEEAERELICRTLRSTAGNKSDAARLLGISRKAIYNKMRRLGIADR